MKRVPMILALFALTAFLGLGPWGCSDDSPTDGNGEVDTTPPGVVGVTAVDAWHIDVEFSEAVDKNSAEDTNHYVFIEGTQLRSPDADFSPGSIGDTLQVAVAVLGDDDRTVTITLWSAMNDAPYDYEIAGVKDRSGNAITTTETGGFDGTLDPDDTSPTVVSHTPVSGATGVPLDQTIEVVFSEAMGYGSVVDAFMLTAGAGPVPFDVEAPEPNVFEFQPRSLLQYNTIYTATISSVAIDLSGNNLHLTTWNFRTTEADDHTPPTLVSTMPADGATNVPVTTNITLQFSEAVDPYSVEGVVITPQTGDGVDMWSPDGSTITFDPNEDLADDTQYVMVIGQSTITDLAGNPMEESIIVRFTTGASLESGRISGDLDGDPGTGAANPADALVVISSVFLFEYSGMGPPPIEGAAITGTGGTYSVTNLVDGTYWPIALKEANDDGYLEFDTGDAVGAYGVDIDAGDWTPETVTIAGGAQIGGIDFPLYDPSAISGEVSYTGSMYAGTWSTYDYYIGLFDRDPSGGDVDPIVADDYLGSEPEYVLNQLDFGFPAGTYYVAAFLDVNSTGDYEANEDPAGFYMDGASLGTVTVANGSDAVDVDIAFEDPDGFAAATAGWRIPPRDESLEARAKEWRRLREIFKRAFGSRR